MERNALRSSGDDETLSEQRCHRVLFVVFRNAICMTFCVEKFRLRIHLEDGLKDYFSFFF